jgi:uncharacterized repeat protein (TIGR01451 family)
LNKSMRKSNKWVIALPLILLMVIMMTTPASADSPIKVNLGTTSTFAVLAGTTITNTGTTIINGDAGGNVGLYPGTALTGWANVTMGTGTVYGGPATAPIKTDLTTAYNDAAGRTPAETITDDLGEQTLTPGIYYSESSIGITGVLTLHSDDPEAAFIFQAGSTLTTAPGSQIKLTGQAKFCRIFWQVGSSATLGTNSVFVGHIFALQSITANTGAHVQGQLLALNGAVTLDNNTITNGICAGDTPPDTTISTAKLTVIKHVVGGEAAAGGFTLNVVSSNSGVVYSAPGDESGTAYASLAAGDYVVSEGAVDGYTASYTVDGVASDSGSITLVAGIDKTVTITNTVVASVPPPVVYPPVVYPPIVNPPVVYPPLINVIKTPTPLALTSAGGSVTYTYAVTNPGVVALSNVSVTDDKINHVSYVSGDVNSDNLLQPSETWIYTATTTLSVTTTNTATVTGGANGMTATDIAVATVNVSSTVYPPLINIIKTPLPLVLTSVGGSVTYTYKVTNPGVVALSDVHVTDDKLSPVNYVSGDVNSDGLLQTDETWIYTGTMTLSATTTNTATVIGSANGATATDIAIVTVVVPSPVGTTVTGGQLPVTATPWYTILLAGAVLIIIGTVTWRIKRFYE